MKKILIIASCCIASALPGLTNAEPDYVLTQICNEISQPVTFSLGGDLKRFHAIEGALSHPTTIQKGACTQSGQELRFKVHSNYEHGTLAFRLTEAIGSNPGTISACNATFNSGKYSISSVACNISRIPHTTMRLQSGDKHFQLFLSVVAPEAAE